jgi:hypothetical protein
MAERALRVVTEDGNPLIFRGEVAEESLETKAASSVSWATILSDL